MKILYTNAISEVFVKPKSTFMVNKSIVRNYKKRIGRKFLFIPIYEIIPEAVFNWWDDECVFTVDEFNEKRGRGYVGIFLKNEEVLIENETFYLYPHCTIVMNNGSQHSVFFDTVEQLDEYVKELKLNGNHIVIK